MGKGLVFCNDCAWRVNNFECSDDCRAPSNVVEKPRWWGMSIRYIMKPRRKNRHNNCPDFHSIASSRPNVRPRG